MATKLFLRSTQANGIGATYFDMLAVAGAGSTTAVVGTTTAGTEIQWTQTDGGAELLFISGRAPVGGFTLTTTDISIWAHESGTGVDAKGAYRIFKRAFIGGIETELLGGLYSDDVEFTKTTPTEMTWTGNPTDTIFLENDRILLKIKAVEAAAGAMSIGTCTLTYNAADAATGDSFFNIAETVTFKAEDSVLLADDITTGIPTLTSAAIGQTHVLAADDLLSGTPTLGTPVLAITHPLLAEDIATPAPTLGTPAIGQTHVILADDLNAGTPTLTSAALGQTHVILADDLLGGTPTLGTPAITQTQVLLADDLITGAPTLGAPAIGQAHVLLADDVITPAPTLSNPVLTEVGGGIDALLADDIVAGTPTLGTPALAQISVGVAIDLAGPAGTSRKKKGKAAKAKKVVPGKGRDRPGVTFGKSQGQVGGSDFTGPSFFSEPQPDVGEELEQEKPFDLPILPPQPAAEDKFFESMNRLAGDLDQPITQVTVAAPITEPIDEFPTNEDIMALIVMMAEMAEA